MRVHERFFIDGTWVAPSGSGTIDVIEASTEEPVGRIPSGDEVDVDRAVNAAARAFEGWAATPPAERARFIERIKDGLAARADEIAAIISAEVGTPISVAKAVQAGLPISVAGSYPARVRGVLFRPRIWNTACGSGPGGVGGGITPRDHPPRHGVGKAEPAVPA